MDDDLFLQSDKQDLRRTRNLRLVPTRSGRLQGGKVAYGEWCHVVGIFQTLIAQSLAHPSNNHILDVGCGNGLVGIAAEPFIGEKGQCIGLDIQQKCIDFCKKQYPLPNYTFVHHNVHNAWYASSQPDLKSKWPLASNSFDLVTTLSVWTHLSKTDALVYLSETARVLKPRGKAIITFFYLTDDYYASLKQREDSPSLFHMTNQQEWIFDKPVANSENWFSRDDTPEKAVSINEEGMQELVSFSGLKVNQLFPGNWKEVPGIYFQDIVIFEKP